MTAFTDDRITESSSAAFSKAVADLFYTNNDETTKPHVFAIRASTGATVGTCSIAGITLVDPEALSVDRNGWLWYADIGDNDGDHPYVRVFCRVEPGEGNHGDLAWRKYLFTYPGGPRNAETFLTHPITNEKFIISKESTSKLYRLPDTLVENATHTLEAMSPTFGALVSDGTFTIDGRFLLLRRADNNTKVWVYDVQNNWAYVKTMTVTASGQSKCEGITADPDGLNFWTTSEGQNSTIHKIALDPDQEPNTPEMPPSPCGG